MAKSLSAWQKLTWDELDAWTGSRTLARGESYQRQGRVRQLGICDDGSVLATVSGTELYLTQVTLERNTSRGARELTSVCSCPVGINCKHAVATVLELLEQLQRGGEIPKVARDDPRMKLLAGETDDVEAALSGESAAGAANAPERVSDDQLRSFLKSHTKADLVECLMGLCGELPSLRSALADEIAIKDRRFDDLLQAAYREMRGVTAEEAWYDAWQDEGSLPDYGGLKERLKTLLAHGCADEVLGLGTELLQRGTEQINRSEDDGHLFGELAGCLEVVAQALATSSRSDAEKLLAAVRMLREDGFGICEPFGPLLEREWPAEAWSTVADELWVELDQTPLADDSGFPHVSQYHRRQLGDWLIHALDAAGRFEEALEVCLSEAERAGEYLRAIDRLLAEKQLDTAEALAREGLESVNPVQRGTISQLQDRIAEIAKRRKDWAVPASLAAGRFFAAPTVERYRDLLKAAKKAKCEAQVAQAAMKFLETGKRPDLKRDGSRKQRTSKIWPLPPPPEPREKSSIQPAPRRDEPHYSVLIALAIAEKRPDEVLKWYGERQRAAQASRLRRSGVSRGDIAIAEAIEQSHPDRAIEIYRELAHSIADETKVETYPEVGRLLKRIEPLLANAKTEWTWEGILAEFRSRHGRKRRLMEVLDRVNVKRVASSLTQRRT